MSCPSFDTSQLPTYTVLQQYMDNVAAIGGGDVTFYRVRTRGGADLTNNSRRSRPGCSMPSTPTPVFHAGDGGLALAVDAIDVDLESRGGASGVWDFVDRFYQETHNLKMVALMSVSMEGYHLFTKGAPFGGR